MGPEALQQFVNLVKPSNALLQHRVLTFSILLRVWKSVIKIKNKLCKHNKCYVLTDQAGKLAGSPLMDPSKNPELTETIAQAATAQQPQ